MCQSLRGNEYSSILVCVDTYDGSVMKGRFYSPRQGEAFESLSEFLVQTERLMGNIGNPHPDTVPHPYSELLPERCGDSAPILSKGKKATFELRVLFRRHASWQGVLCWKENSQQQRFRSVLELVLLMNNALLSA